MKLQYIQRNAEGISIRYDKVVVNSAMTPQKYINLLCIENNSTLRGRKDAIKKKFNIKSLTPIYVNDEILLFPTISSRHYDSLWVNYHEIASTKNDKITMNNGEILQCETKIVKKQLKNCFEIAFS